ncbi:MAG: nitrate- and nitrite sensing domain-containing protein [Hyphomicrobiales bacterium]|nr:nitrate- and nitrite sensing domain-containing protein [Hyphomicrobiales bacterium]
MIDADHARLLDLLAKIETAQARGHRRTVARLLRGFLAAFDRHFEAEARILRDLGSPDLDRRHSEFITSRSWLVSHPLDVRDSEQIGRIVAFVRAWLYDHVGRQDGAVSDDLARRSPRRRFMRRFGLGVIPLRWRLMLIGAIPLVIMLGLTSIFFHELVNGLKSADLLRAVVAVDAKIGDLVFELQEEGNQAIMIVGSPRRDRALLDEQRSRTDVAIAGYREAEAALRAQASDRGLLDAFDNADASLALLTRSRSDVQTGSYDVYSTIEYYETIVADLMEIAPMATRRLDPSDVARRVSSWVFLAKARERAGAERMLGTSLLAGVMVNVLSHDTRYVAQLATEQETLTRTFVTLTGGRIADLFAASATVSPMLDNMRRNLEATDAARPTAIDWSDTAGLRLQRMRAIERKLVAEIEEQTADVAASARNHVTLVGGGMLLVVALSLGFIALLGWSVLPPLHRLGIALRRLSDGERLVKIPDADGQDDIAGLARNVVALRDRLIQGDLLEARRGTETADRLRTTLDSLPGIVFRIAQMDGEPARVVAVSRKLQQLIGLRDKDVLDRSLGMVLRACIEPEDRLALLHLLRRIGGGPIDFECRLKRDADKRPVWVRILASPVETGNGRLWDGVALDVTAAKLAEMERRRLQEELDRRHLSQATNRIASGIGGELSQLWAPLRENAERIFREVPAGSPLWRTAREIHDVALRTQKLAEQLELARDGGRAAQPVDVVDRLAVAFATTGPKAPPGILLETSFEAREARVACDPASVDQMIANLIGYVGETLGSEPGVVSIRTDLSTADGGRHLRISIHDDRSTQAPRTLSKVLRHQTSRVGDGRGDELSLAIVRLVVDGARGWIQSRVTSPSGSSLEIFLPVLSERANNVIPLERTSRWSRHER